MESDSYLDSDISNISFGLESVSDECFNKKGDKMENIVDVTSELRVDILRLLNIIKKMESEKKVLYIKIKELEKKIKKIETNSDNTVITDTSVCVSNSSKQLTQDVCELNEFEIKLDKLKKETNEEFINFKSQITNEFAVFRQNIIQASRIRNN